MTATAEARAALEDELRAACAAGDWNGATAAAIRGYGGELLGYLNALLRVPADADEVFAEVCEKLWRGLPAFTWSASFRTWAYAVARNTCISFVRGNRKRRAEPLSTDAAAAIAVEVRHQTASFQRTDTKDRLAEVRAALDPDDQTLLILRIDRNLPWREIARVFEPDDATPAAIDRRAAALRKRLERLKDEVRARLAR